MKTQTKTQKTLIAAAAAVLMTAGMGAATFASAAPRPMHPAPVAVDMRANAEIDARIRNLRDDIRMGERIDARRFLNEVERDQPNAVGLHELRGVMAVQDQDYPLARHELEAAIAQRQDRHEVWHNYSLVLEHDGEIELALAAEARAKALSPLPDYQFRMAILLEQLGRNADAAELYATLVQSPPSQSDGKAWAAQAAARLRVINSLAR